MLGNNGDNYEYIVTFVDEYDLDMCRCDDIGMSGGFVLMASGDAKDNSDFSFAVNNHYVKDIALVEEGDNTVIGVDVE